MITMSQQEQERLTKRKAKIISKMFLSGLIVNCDGFDSDLLTYEENKLIQDECMKMALKIFNGKTSADINEIVKIVLAIDSTK